MTYWLSYGGGVNSTALAVLWADGRLPWCDPLRIIFADTGDEEEHTYSYIRDVFTPWLLKRGMVLETVRPKETVLGRWKRNGVTGSRLIRSCTDHAKILPMQSYRLEHGNPGDVILIGIHADESHRAKKDCDDKGFAIRYPLVELGMGQSGCIETIKAAGLPLPGKSGCWHCPFKRVPDVLELAKNDPCRFGQIVELERVATEKHGPDPATGGSRCQWNKKPAVWYAERANRGWNDGELFAFDREDERPCGCMDGTE